METWGKILLVEDTSVVPTDQQRGEWKRVKPQFRYTVHELRGSDYREVQRNYDANVLLIPTDNERRKAHILEAMSAAPQHVIMSAMEGFRDYDAAAAAEDRTAPALYIAADEPQPRVDMARFHELCSQMMYSKTVGSSHFCQLEVPEQVNPMIERFLTIALPG